MSKLFMYGTSLEGMEQLAVECTNHASLPVAFLGIPDMGPIAIYFINRVRAPMFMVTNFQPGGNGIVINNYFKYGGSARDCNCKAINVNKRLDKCGYINSGFKTNVDINKEYLGIK